MGKASAEPPPWQAQLFDDFEDLLRPLKSSIIRSAGKKRNTGKKSKKSKSKEKPVSTPRRYARSFIIWISPTVAWCIGLGVEAVRELLVSSIKFMIKACILLIFGSAGYLTVWQHYEALQDMFKQSPAKIDRNEREIAKQQPVPKKPADIRTGTPQANAPPAEPAQETQQPAAPTPRRPLKRQPTQPPVSDWATELFKFDRW